MEAVESHYACPDLVEKIRAGLDTQGKSEGSLAPRDLAAVDQLHTGGAMATITLIEEWLALKKRPDTPYLLDAGCGNGGSCRLIADRFGFKVKGVDLSADLIETAQALTDWCGLDIGFHRGSVLDLPFGDWHFDAVLCQHILVNVEDRKKALSEFKRVLKPGGSLILHEITRGEGPPPVMPVPWASNDGTSFIVPWQRLATDLERAGFECETQKDLTDQSAAWWQSINARKKKGAPPALHPGLVFGKNARFFGQNMETNFTRRSVRCIAATLIRS